MYTRKDFDFRALMPRFLRPVLREGYLIALGNPDVKATTHQSDSLMIWSLWLSDCGQNLRDAGWGGWANPESYHENTGRSSKSIMQPGVRSWPASKGTSRVGLETLVESSPTFSNAEENIPGNQSIHAVMAGGAGMLSCLFTQTLGSLWRAERSRDSLLTLPKPSAVAQLLHRF